MSYTLNRRGFLTGLAATGALSGLILKYFESSDIGSETVAPYWMGCTHPANSAVPSLTNSSSTWSGIAFRARADHSIIESVSCSVAGHSIETIPGRPNQALVISKNQPAVCIVDWTKSKEVSTTRLPEHQNFYGHGLPLFAQDSFLDRYVVTGYTQGADHRPLKSNLFIVDTAEGSVVEAAQFEFTNTHQLCRVSDQSFLMGTSGTSTAGATVGLVSEFSANPGTSPQLTLFKSPFQPDPKRRVGHQVRVSDSQTIWGSQQVEAITDGTVSNTGTSLLFADEKTQEISIHSFENDLAHSELLSMSYDRIHDRLWLSFPQASKIVAYAVSDRKIEKSFFMPKGASFVLVGKDQPLNQFIVVGSLEQVSLIDRASLKLVQSHDLFDRASIDKGTPDSIVSHAFWS